MEPPGSRKHQARAVAAAAARMNPSPPVEHEQRLARALRALASDLGAARRRSKELELEVRQLKAALAKVRGTAS